MKTYFACIFATVLLFPASSLAQYNQDIGLKIGTNDYDKFQLEYRWHPNNKWALLGNVNYGKLYWDDHSSSMLDGDSTMAYVHKYSITNTFTVSIGALRKFHLMEHNFYYAGANIGFGGALNDFSTYRSVYLVDTAQVFFGPNFHMNEIERSETHQGSSYVMATTRLYLGADVPIFNRLSLNVEAGYRGMLAIYSKNSGMFDLRFFATGGLRYKFGGTPKE